MNPLKIVFSTDTLKRGGKERQLSLLYSKLCERNLIYILVRKSDSSTYVKEYQIIQDKILFYENFSQYKKQIEIVRPNLVIAWDTLSAFYNILLYRKIGYKFINGSIRHGIRLLRYSHLLRSLLCHISPYVMSNSFAGLSANNLRPGKRRFILYNGIENKFIRNISDSELIRKRNELIPNYEKKPGTVFITVANFVPYKDHISVLKALNEFKEVQNFYYFIIGDGPMRSVIEKIVKKYKLEEKVFLLGRVENVKEYLFISDIMLHSSKGEGLSNAILEGMYAGLPIIASNVGGIPETVFPNSSMLFQYKNYKSLLDCLLKSSTTFASFDPNSANYKKHIAKFSVESMLDGFEKITNSIIK